MLVENGVKPRAATTEGDGIEAMEISANLSKIRDSYE